MSDIKRKLASVQVIEKLSSIKNADNIETADVLGWHVVVKKGEFKVGDRCVYVEIDSILPSDNPAFSFMTNRNYKVKTVKLRGQISQGICFPLDILPDGEYNIGQDVTDILGIKKFELNSPKVGDKIASENKGLFPSFLVKTDEIRAQSIPDIVKSLENTKMYITEKLDGSSITIYTKDHDFGVCSRRYEKRIDDDNIFTKTALKYKEIIKSLNMNIAFQGELVGPKIQSNRLKFKENDIYFFNVYDINSGEFYDFENMLSILSEIKLKVVPIVEYNFILNHTIDELVNLSIGKSLINSKIYREGIVIRSKKEMYIDKLGRCSFKVINPKYLLKYDE